MGERSVLQALVRGQLLLFLLFGAAAAGVFRQVNELADIPRRTLDENFRSIVATEEMDRALAAMVAEPGDKSARDRFERALSESRSDVSEIGEREVVQSVQREYAAFLATPTVEQARRLKEDVSRIFRLNEVALVKKNEAASSVAHRLAVSILILLGVGFVGGTLGAARAAGQIAGPLRKLAIAVAGLGERGPYQRLPAEGYTEARTLAREFNELAGRLERYERSNLDQILAEKAKLEAIMASMSEGVIVTDGYNRILLANAVARRAFDAKELGGPLEQAPGDPALRAAVARVTERPGRVIAEVPIGAGRDQRMYSLNAAFVREGEKQLGTVVVLRDVTVLRRGEAERGELMAKLTHELRTPLTSAAISLGVLGDDPVAPEKHRQVMELLRGDLVRLKALSDDIHQMARAQLANSELVKEVLSTAELVRAVAKPFSLQAEQRNVRFEVECAPDLPPLYADRNRLPWVFSNLCSNALRYTPSGGRVTVRAGGDRDSVLFEVVDTGPGIAKEDQVRLFDKFTQGSSPNAGMAGLGLFIAREIVEAHGGFIGVESEPGRGSRFFFHLPTRHA
jgi:signal transduction histidine kinase